MSSEISGETESPTGGGPEDPEEKPPAPPASMLIGLGIFIVAMGAFVVFAIRYGGVTETQRILRELDAPAGPRPSGDPPPLAAAGRIVYERNCLACHGERLSGTAEAPKLNQRRYAPPRWEDQDLANVIYGGKGEMPAFRERISPEEIAAVVAYIRWEQGLPFGNGDSPGSRPESKPNPGVSGFVPP